MNRLPREQLSKLPLVFLIGVLFVSPTAVFPQRSDAARQLHALFEEEWERQLREQSLFASMLGDRRYNDQWPDFSLEAIERSHHKDLEVLKKLQQIDYESLNQDDKLNYRLFQRNYEMAVERHQYRDYLIPLDQRSGIQTVDEQGRALRFATVKDHEDWIARLRSFPTYLDQTVALMREGMRVGMVQPKVVMRRVSRQIRTHVVERPEESSFFFPFEKYPEEFDSFTRRRLTAAAKRAISDHIIPSYREFLTFFEEEYLPSCLDGVGAWRLPNGREMYSFLARSFTTTDQTPQQIHETGLREVERIRAEMEGVIEQTDFDGSFAEFLDFLRTDPRFYYNNPEELLQGYRALSKRIDPTLVKLFKKLPRLPYGVEPIPEQTAPDTTTAYYRRPAADGSRAGTYFVNLYQPETRPKYEMEALSMHEAVPGHHLQIALAMELDNLPDFRRYTSYTAFVEGWGLYSESLGGELGFYTDPYSKFGQLTYEMWRAVRLVVDTGMHELQWTRQQAIDYFKKHAAKSEQDIINEVDRYIAWPGQALAYKIGELKIKELRHRAQAQLGKKFDIRDFHDAVLRNGALPLDILDSNVKRWIAQVSAQEK